MTGILWLALVVAIAVILYQLVEWIIRRAGVRAADEDQRSRGFHDVIDVLRERIERRQPPQNS